MIFLYWVFVQLSFGLYKIASWFNSKAKLFVEGRKNWRNSLAVQFEKKSNAILWFHCASVGEFEQARPIIEFIRERNFSVKILLTFFSPSGYELRKNYDKVDVVAYLPLDSPKNARDFVSITKPDLAIFIKYEFWHYYIKELNNKKIPIWSVSSIFRKEQIYFKWYGGFYAKILSDVIIPFLKNNNQLYAIIAPHELKEEYFSFFEKKFPNECLKYSEANEENIVGKRILWIDNVGMLSRLYRYGKYAYVGGAFGKGLHNTVEAACYGIPVFFGNKKYQKFLEAKEMITKGVAFAIADENELQQIFMKLQNHNVYVNACEQAMAYVNSKTGATKIVVEEILRKVS